MARENTLSPENEPKANRARAKKPYEKPAFRHERIFETMALACGKHDSTQQQCHLNTKNS